MIGLNPFKDQVLLQESQVTKRDKQLVELVEEDVMYFVLYIWF